jgi:hypothetical protein
MELPAFLNYYGDCSLGNHVCINNELIANNSSYCNLTIPAGVTAKILPAVTTIIYVRDTLFLNGTLSGVGSNGGAYNQSSTINHIGATGSGSDGRIGNDGYAVNFNFSWNSYSQPSTVASFGGSLSVPAGSPNIIGCCHISCDQPSSGSSLSTSILRQVIHFGLDISGGNGSIMQPQYSPVIGAGQGGGGLYIIAKNISFIGTIELNGGNGIYYNNANWNATWANTGGGGGGACLLRTTHIINASGNFNSIGGQKQNNCNGIIKGGDGAMIIVAD